MDLKSDKAGQSKRWWLTVSYGCGQSGQVGMGVVPADATDSDGRFKPSRKAITSSNTSSAPAATSCGARCSSQKPSKSPAAVKARADHYHPGWATGSRRGSAADEARASNPDTARATGSRGHPGHGERPGWSGPLAAAAGGWWAPPWTADTASSAGRGGVLRGGGSDLLISG